MTVWKFALALADYQAVNMPEGAEILHLGEQGDDLFLWARVDPERPNKTRYFTVVGTGHIAPKSSPFVGTVLTRGGSFVWHVFEEFPA